MCRPISCCLTVCGCVIATMSLLALSRRDWITTTAVVSSLSGELRQPGILPFELSTVHCRRSGFHLSPLPVFRLLKLFPPMLCMMPARRRLSSSAPTRLFADSTLSPGGTWFNRFVVLNSFSSSIAYATCFGDNIELIICAQVKIWIVHSQIVN